MRRTLIVLSLLLPVAAHADKPRKPVPPLPAAQYRFHDTHVNEHVTIAAEPGDIRETQPDTRIDYLAHDMLPVRIIVTNDSDRPITLEEARIDFIATDNSKITAATPDDLNRRLYQLKQSAAKKIPLPAPLPDITYHQKPIDTKILADDRDFGFTTTTVAPHSTVAGYLYYDIQGLDTPALKNATLELRRVRYKEANTSEYLDSFEIPLQPTSKK
jgi:hypothetical protein